MSSVTETLKLNSGRNGYSVGPPRWVPVPRSGGEPVPVKFGATGYGLDSGWVRLPLVGKRGVFTEAESLALWPVAAAVYTALGEAEGPVSPESLAADIGLDEEEVEAALWWLTFADNNGHRQMVHGVSAFGRRADRRFVYRADRPDLLPEAERLGLAFVEVTR